MIWKTRPRSEGPGGLHYWSEGEGPALVLIHGVGLRAEAWAAMMPALASHFTVYAVDMPGHGVSPLQGETQLSDYTARIVRLVQSLDGPVSVAGHSMGAMITLDLAISCPETVRSIVAMNAVFERTPQAAKAVQARAADLRRNGFSDPTPTLQRWFGAAPTDELQAASNACSRWLTTVNPGGYSTAYTVFAYQNGPARDALANMKAPALFLTGAGDPNSTSAMSQTMAALASRGQSHIIKDAAHMSPMTHASIIAKALISHAQEAQT